jgi:hypothetical protein
MLTRRQWLGWSGAALASAASLPLLRSRRARATEATGSVSHVLILFAQGGMRGHTLFNASSVTKYNPYGRLEGAAGTQWSVGGVCGSGEIETASLGAIPGFPTVTSDMAVVTSIDHDPEEDPIVDHDPALVACGTGVLEGTEGFLSRIIQGHPRYQNGTSANVMPPVDIGRTPLGVSSTVYRPLRLNRPKVGARPRMIQRDWATDVRDELNARFRTRRVTTPFELRVSVLEESKTMAFEFASVLADPLLDIFGAPEATDGGFTNAQLLEVLGNHDLRDLGDRESIPSWGPDVALALRSFAFGVPAAVVRRDIYDTHSFESTNLPIRAGDLARQLAGLNYLLKRMPHPSGGTYFDKTLVVVFSEFARNNTDDDGFNSGNGSDHLNDEEPAPMRHHPVAFMGGALVAAGTGGKLVGGTSDSMVPNGPVYTLRSVYSTLLDVLGATNDFWSDPPITELFA